MGEIDRTEMFKATGGPVEVETLQGRVDGVHVAGLMAYLSTNDVVGDDRRKEEALDLIAVLKGACPVLDVVGVFWGIGRDNRRSRRGERCGK